MPEWLRRMLETGRNPRDLSADQRRLLEQIALRRSPLVSELTQAQLRFIDGLVLNPRASTAHRLTAAQRAWLERVHAGVIPFPLDQEGRGYYQRLWHRVREVWHRMIQETLGRLEIRIQEGPPPGQAGASGAAAAARGPRMAGACRWGLPLVT